MKQFFTCTLLIIACLCSLNSTAQITGTVYRDYNGDGVLNNTTASGTNAANIEPGVPSVFINAFNASDVLIATQLTNANGVYAFAVGNGANQIPNGTAVRLELVLPQNCSVNSTYDFIGMAGINYGSNVQFKTQSVSVVTANFAINYPSQYKGSNNPKVFVPRLSNGNPLAAGNAANQIAMYSFNYTANGQGNTGNELKTSLATAAQIGSCWGVAYNKYNDRVYTAAYLKRHSGLGPGGPSGSPNPANAPGSIYMINPNVTNSGSYFFSMDNLGAAYYTHDHTANAALNVRDNNARGLSLNIDINSADPTAFDQIGKVGIGDIELSDDGRYLWLTNLYDKKLYRVDLTNATAPVAPTSATASSLVTSWSLPALTCSNGALRPFGLKFYKGKIYVGVVCTGENDANANSTSNINTNYNSTTVVGGCYNTGNAYVLELNPAGAGVWSTLLTIPLNYPRGNAADENLDITRWYNWTSNFDALKAYPSNTSGALIHPQPILSNIEFDTDGTLMIGFMDRLGDQTGLNNSDVNGNSNYYGELGGDLLRAFNNGCTYQLETNGKEGASSSKTATAGANTGQGFGSGTFGSGGANYGEFYWDERYFWPSSGAFAHGETSLGSLAFLPGSNEILTGIMDPLDVYTNGVNRFSNLTGAGNGRYEVIQYAEPGTFAKANSLGDLELMTTNSPIEIGNRVWNDLDGDGIQDANETGMQGVELELVNGSNTVIATVATNANGNYYFSSASGTNTAGITYGVNIAPNTSYSVRIKGTVSVTNSINGNAGLGATNYITRTNIQGNGQPGISDNDGLKVGGTGGSYKTSITTGMYGQNNFDIDFGFTPLIVLATKLINFTATPSGKNVQINWMVSDQSTTSNYQVEYSIDGNNFNVIANVVANQSLVSYNIAHQNPINGVNYYRLKITDKNGKVTYSEIRKVTIASISLITVYPNPAKDKLYININSSIINKPAILQLISIEGKLLYQKNVNVLQSKESIDLTQIANGDYILKIITSTEVFNISVARIK